MHCLADPVPRLACSLVSFQKILTLMISKGSCQHNMIEIYLLSDNETISRDNSRLAYNSNENTLSMVNASRTLNWSDNGRLVRCVAEHMALDEPKEVVKQLQVYCK